MSVNLDGVFVPVITPFSKGNQEISIDMLRQNIRKLNSTNISGYMPLGSNGEFFMLTDEEAITILKVIKEEAGKDKMVFAGAGRESTKGTIEFTKKVAHLGINAVFILTPHYFPKQMTQESLISFYTEVADASPVPVILYSAPAYAAGVMIEPQTSELLAKHHNIVGIKDTSKKPISEYTSAVKNNKEFSVLAGTFGKFVSGIINSASGGVLSSANYIPEICCDLYDLIKKGEVEKAEKIHQILTELASNTTALYGISGVKAAMNIMGYSCGVPRRPLKEINSDQFKNLEEKLKAGIIEVYSVINQ